MPMPGLWREISGVPSFQAPPFSSLRDQETLLSGTTGASETFLAQEAWWGAPQRDGP